MEKTAEKQQTLNLVARPPIAVVMGHIDHGKTSLLDWIRKTKVAEKESGGITQHIGAYQVEHQGKKITFIDTPGHEAFFKMRSRGAHVADIAVLVVAADEGVKPQTEEAIATIKKTDLPFLVAINKTDKPEANPEKVKRELAEKEVLLEGYGGKVPFVAVSAKTGQGLSELLETILLLAELEELKTDPTQPASGLIIESHLDPRRGTTATLLLTEGTLKQGELVVVGRQIAPVRIFENFLGQPLESAAASDAVRIVGFGQLPALGEEFRSFPGRAQAETFVAALVASPSLPSAPSAFAAEVPVEGKIVFNIILKADVLGSKEALEEVLNSIRSETIETRILKSEVGNITESDIMLAAAGASTIIVGFRIKMASPLEELAERSGVKVVLGDVIYELIDAVKSAMREVAPAKVERRDFGRAKILATFRASPGKQVVGGRIETGKIQKGARFDVIRNGLKIGGGNVLGLQTQRRDVDEVAESQEFGILTDAGITIAVGDELEIFVEEKVIPQL